MRKRLWAFSLALSLLLPSSGVALACDENQSDTYVTQILFGDSALSQESDSNVQLLLDALCLCSEQSGSSGEMQLNMLSSEKVKKVPELSAIQITDAELLPCAHNSWEHVYDSKPDTQNARKQVLTQTVDHVFDFGGFLEDWFGTRSEKCESFAALLYYSHILADYLADNPEETQVRVGRANVSSYAGEPYITLNSNRPNFSDEQKKSTTSGVTYSSQDRFGRCGTAYAVIGSDILAASDSRAVIGNIRPSGWRMGTTDNQNKYDGLVDTNPPYLYHRCHLIAHQLGGEENGQNLITGTRYLNINGMKVWEDKIADYMKKNPENHVLYRVTPVFVGDNLLASGVRMEAWSVEDQGKLRFNIYCYNVQPGVDLDYATGANSQEDTISAEPKVIPFAKEGASESDPDLIFALNKHLEILFADQAGSGIYDRLMSEIGEAANGARNLKYTEDKTGKNYIQLKTYEFKYLEALTTYVPLLLQKEDFFQSAF